MAVKLWATFRLKKNQTYDTRYAAMVKAFEGAGSNFWAEPTSFYVFDTEYSIDVVAAHIKKSIDPTVDLVVFRQVAVNDVRYIGVLENPATFKAHFPDAKKV